MKPVKLVHRLGSLPLDQWIELLQNSRRETPDVHEDQIVDYLESGTCWAVVLGVEEDPLSDTRKIIGAPHLRTDGVWAWPETLVYFICQYHITLEPAFMAHMASNNWKCPVDLDTSELRIEGWVSMD